MASSLEAVFGPEPGAFIASAFVLAKVVGGAAVATVAVLWLPIRRLIGPSAAYGVALQARQDASDAALAACMERLAAARTTAINLAWALGRMRERLMPLPVPQRCDAAWAEAAALCDEDVRVNEAIGRHALPLIEAIARRRPGPVRVLTHSNAGWLATVDRGTATAPIYAAAEAGVEVFVWVDETRPRNQGASLTAWELGQQGVPHKVVVVNAGGHLMQHGEVDLVIVGTDRVSAQGDVCNKIGTYLKALAAHDNGEPSTWRCRPPRWPVGA